LEGEIPYKLLSEVENSDNMRELGAPFLAFGYLVKIYDALFNNIDNQNIHFPHTRKMEEKSESI